MPAPTTSAPSAPASAPKRTGHPEWTVDDALALRNFLSSLSGLRAMSWLRYWAPVLLDGEHKNKTLVASGQVKGYNEAIEFLRSLTEENPVPDEPKAVSEYPDLDDDKKWTAEQSSRE